MYTYQGSSEQQKRLAKDECRCGSQGIVHDLAALLREGRIVDPMQMEINLSTPDIRTLPDDPLPPGGGYGKTFIFAVDKDFEVHVAPDSERANAHAIKHETLFHNADVRAAGEICIQEGVIVNLNDHSGSYKTVGKLETDSDFADAVLRASDLHDLPVDSVLRHKLENLITP
ncbi:MAG: hypothetical protein QOI07_956 [Verrucomicrobiota bacterium]|jgi:hypothetical protein